MVAVNLVAGYAILCMLIRCILGISVTSTLLVAEERPNILLFLVDDMGVMVPPLRSMRKGT